MRVCGGLGWGGTKKKTAFGNLSLQKAPDNVAHSDKTGCAPGLNCTDVRNTECPLYTNTVLYVM